jgi:type II secretion system protein G
MLGGLSHPGEREAMKRSHAFTLIELLIVVAIIGILAAIAVPNFMNAQVRAKASRALGDMRSIWNALEMYRTDCNAYMMGPSGLAAAIGSDFMGDRVWRQLTTPIAYLSMILKDPFVPIENPVSPDAANRFFPLGLYQYRNVREDREQGAQGDPHPRAEWLARSPGPDRWFFRQPSRLYRSFAYAPSNGVMSAGDIIVSNLGILGENDKGREGLPPT